MHTRYYIVQSSVFYDFINYYVMFQWLFCIDIAFTCSNGRSNKTATANRQPHSLFQQDLPRTAARTLPSATGAQRERRIRTEEEMTHRDHFLPRPTLPTP